jgi:hypothetical protein
MNALWTQRTEGIIHKAVSCHARQAGEARAGNMHREVPPLARACMAGVQVAVIHHFQGYGSKCSGQDLFQRSGSGCGGQGFAW